MNSVIVYALILGALMLPFFFWKWLLAKRKPGVPVNNYYAAFLSVITGIVIISVTLAVMLHTGK